MIFYRLRANRKAQGFIIFLNAKSQQLKKPSFRACLKLIGCSCTVNMRSNPLETADWSRFPRRVTTNEHFSSQITYLSVRINFGWQFSDVYKRLFLCPRQVKRGCHVTCPSLLFNSLLVFWVLSEGILKTLVFWGYPKLGDRHCLFLALENCAYLGMGHDCRQISVHIFAPN